MLKSSEFGILYQKVDDLELQLLHLFWLQSY
jgi:hypothetical protein